METGQQAPVAAIYSGQSEQQPILKSSHLEAEKIDTGTQRLLPSPIASNASLKTEEDRKRKRSEDRGTEELPEKRRCASINFTGEEAVEDTATLPKSDRKHKPPETGFRSPEAYPLEERARIPQETPVVEDNEAALRFDQTNHPISHWVLESKWPRDYCEPKAHHEPKKYVNSEIYFVPGIMPLARKRSMAAIQPEASDSRPTSEQTTTESAPYCDTSFETMLGETAHSFLKDSSEGITEDDKARCLDLLEAEQTYPQGTLFGEVFEAACSQLSGRNEARVISDFARLLVPSAETLAVYGATELEHLIVSLNERWNRCVAAIPTLPQPDYSVGFKRSAFTADQLKRFKSFVGDVKDAASSFFLATGTMYFPFLTSEAKCSAGNLNIADRQNANSMTVALRGVVELFRFVKREKELHRRVLAFSISHSDEFAKIYAHYPIIGNGDGEIAYYRHLLQGIHIPSNGGRDRWTTYRFTKNVYYKWMPDHLRLICSAIDAIPPDMSFGVSAGGSSTFTAPVELADSEGMEQSASSSQNSGAKKQRLGVQAMTRQANERLQKELTEERERHQATIERQTAAIERLEESHREEREIHQKEREIHRQQMMEIMSSILQAKST